MAFCCHSEWSISEMSESKRYSRFARYDNCIKKGRLPLFSVFHFKVITCLTAETLKFSWNHSRDIWHQIVWNSVWNFPNKSAIVSNIDIILSSYKFIFNSLLSIIPSLINSTAISPQFLTSVTFLCSTDSFVKSL